ncbi:hypothetical protein HY632_04265 [Candidatus Uhrbacteria bacterium]|nr:hypothetical protein [Candidatus Uhrbacteria bacterium]
MQLTVTQLVERIAQYVGGQMEVQNLREGYLYRGEVKTIAVDGDKIKVAFAWIAQGKGFPPFPTQWINHDRLDHAFRFSSVGHIGPGTEGGDRLLLQSLIGELIVIYPPDGSKLDPAKVEGLQFAPP